MPIAASAPRCAEVSDCKLGTVCVDKTSQWGLDQWQLECSDCNDVWNNIIFPYRQYAAQAGIPATPRDGSAWRITFDTIAAAAAAKPEDEAWEAFAFDRW